MKTEKSEVLSPASRVESPKKSSHYENVASKLYQTTKAVLHGQRDKVKTTGGSKEKTWNSSNNRQSFGSSIYSNEIHHQPSAATKNSNFSGITSKLMQPTRATVSGQREKVKDSSSNREKAWKFTQAPPRLDLEAPKPPSPSVRDRMIGSISSRLFEPTAATKSGRWQKDSSAEDLKKGRPSTTPHKPPNKANIISGDYKSASTIDKTPKKESPLPTYKERLDLFKNKKADELLKIKTREKTVPPQFRVSTGSLSLSQANSKQAVGNYQIYRKLVGESDGGELLSEEEFHKLQEKAKYARTNKLYCSWKNSITGNECYSIGPDSRCFCGHMYKSHAWYNIDDKFVHCRVPDCDCDLFSYINGHGTWFIKCTCKHSYHDHNDRGVPSRCHHANCDCNGFNSTFTCSCGEKWCNHATVLENESERKKPLLTSPKKENSNSHSNSNSPEKGGAPSPRAVDVTELLLDYTVGEDLNENDEDGRPMPLQQQQHHHPLKEEDTPPSDDASPPPTQHMRRKSEEISLDSIKLNPTTFDASNGHYKSEDDTLTSTA